MMHYIRDRTGLSGLMAGTDSGARIAVEVFVKQNQISPVRVGLEFLQVAEHGPPALFIAQESAGQATRQFSGNLPQGHHLSRASWALDLEIVAQVVVEFLQALDQKKIHR